MNGLGFGHVAQAECRKLDAAAHTGLILMQEAWAWAERKRAEQGWRQKLDACEIWTRMSCLTLIELGCADTRVGLDAWIGDGLSATWAMRGFGPYLDAHGRRLDAVAHTQTWTCRLGDAGLAGFNDNMSSQSPFTTRPLICIFFYVANQEFYSLN